MEHPAQSAIAREAAHWFVQNRSEGLSFGERAAFARWLKRSPLHVEQYLKTVVLSQELHAVMRTMSIDLDALLVDARAADRDNVLAFRQKSKVPDPVGQPSLVMLESREKQPGGM